MSNSYSKGNTVKRVNGIVLFNSPPKYLIFTDFITFYISDEDLRIEMIRYYYYEDKVDDILSFLKPFDTEKIGCIFMKLTDSDKDEIEHILDLCRNDKNALLLLIVKFNKILYQYIDWKWFETEIMNCLKVILDKKVKDLYIKFLRKYMKEFYKKLVLHMINNKGG